MISKLKPITFIDHFVDCTVVWNCLKSGDFEWSHLDHKSAIRSQTDMAVASSVTSLYLDNSVFYGLF